MRNECCNLCPNHCPLDALGCGRGRRMFGGEGAPGEGRMERRGEEWNRGPERGGPRAGGVEGPEMDFAPPHGGGRGLGRPHGGPERGFDRPHDGPPGGPRGGRHRGGRPPHPASGPMAEYMHKRIERGSLTELMEMCGHALHHRPEALAGRGQQRILAILAERECLSQRQLQEMLRIQPGSMSEILTKLERKGLLTRERGEDRRGNRLRITEAGRQAAESAPAPEEDLFSALSEAQQEQLKALLQCLLKDWMNGFGRGNREAGE